MSVRLQIIVQDDVVLRLDQARGDVSRSAYVRRLILTHLGDDEIVVTDVQEMVQKVREENPPIERPQPYEHRHEQGVELGERFEKGVKYVDFMCKHQPCDHVISRRAKIIPTKRA